MSGLLLLLPFVPIMLLIVALARSNKRSNPADLWAANVAPGKPAFLWRDLPAILLCYALYAVLIALGCVVVFIIWPRAILVLLAVFMPGNSWNRFIYLSGMLLIALGVFTTILASERYLHSGIERRQIVRRFVQLAVPLGITGALGLLLQKLAFSALN